jgi:hypothetical protein
MTELIGLLNAAMASDRAWALCVATETTSYPMNDFFELMSAAIDKGAAGPWRR